MIFRSDFLQVLRNNSQKGLKNLLKEKLIGFDYRFSDEEKKKSTLLHLAVANDIDLQMIKFLISEGISLESKDQKTPLFYLLDRRRTLENIKSFIELSPNLNAHDGDTIIHHSIKNGIEEEVIRFLIESGADPNSTNNDTPLHHACYFKKNKNLFFILLKNGSNIYIKNENSPKDLVKILKLEKEIEQLFEQFDGYYQDFYNLFARKEFTDLTFKSKEGETIQAHSIIIENRIQGKSIEKLSKILETKTTEQVNDYLKFIYTGITENEVMKKELINQIELELGISNSQEREKQYFDDLKNLYENGKKDFEIIVDNKRIGVHKVILVARSELYRGMFLLNVNDKSNQVNDYSGKSYETIQALIYYLYLNKLPENITQNAKNELFDATDYYQLNENNSIQFLIQNDD
ncbi:ankyrin repeat-containing protein [Anaeramoeba ignava]|uniref:Ankyrin repeat-containing protein n=1 Tax=Anaeramoeba ignava TaxID=1746090 RepID=A0A9Q0R599_ANAIG|nr:ankyrin repeat-containing protein [Anaeramoeba ignava]